MKKYIYMIAAVLLLALTAFSISSCKSDDEPIMKAYISFSTITRGSLVDMEYAALKQAVPADTTSYYNTEPTAKLKFELTNDIFKIKAQPALNIFKANHGGKADFYITNVLCDLSGNIIETFVVQAADSTQATTAK